MNNTIPTEFMPRKIKSARQAGTTNQSNNDDDEDDDSDDIKLGSLFNSGYDSDESDLSYIIETVYIGDHDHNDYDVTTTTTATTANSELTTTKNNNNTPITNHKPPPPLQFTLRLPPDIGTLFAHRVWSGSKYLSQHLYDNPTIIHHKRIIEFGAGTGLPSLVSLALGCSYCVITDYPEEEVLSALRETVGRNWGVIHDCVEEEKEEGGDRVKVMGHKWGIGTFSLLSSPSSLYDVALLSECLWLHDEHPSLAKSLNDVLKSGGMALLTYAHHVPGKEEEDDSFFELCRERYGFETTLIGSEELEYMWDEEKKVTVYLKMMRKP